AASGPDAWRSPAPRTRRRGRSQSPHARRTTNNGPNAAGSPKAACRHIPGTTGSRPPPTRRPQHQRPRSQRPARSPPRTAAGAPAAPPAAVPATASPAVPLLPSPSLVVAPLTHLPIEALRRPVESALAAGVGVVHQPGQIGHPAAGAGPHRVFEG